MESPPLVTRPGQLRHILTESRVTTGTLESRRIEQVVAHGDKLAITVDRDVVVWMSRGDTPIEIDLVPPRDGASAEPLLGLSARRLSYEEDVVVAAAWEARRDVPEWDVAPEMTFLLVVRPDKSASIVERSELLVTTHHE